MIRVTYESIVIGLRLLVLDTGPVFWYILTMSESSSDSFRRDFLRRRPLAESVLTLFESLPQTYFYAKDRDSRFVMVNQLFLDNHGLEDERQAIGKTDRDFHPPLMAEAYIEEDRRVMANRRTLPGQVWLVLHRRRFPRWYVSTKTPLFDIGGEVIGLAGAMYRIEAQQELTRFFRELLPVVQYIEQHYAESISMSAMAELAGLSATHFNRRFRQLLRMTPMQYLRTVRTQAARRLLTETSRSLLEIAIEIGYTDQSHFTKRFREVTGMTPAAYRKRFVK
jgi:AraC-like DNA-binding protein